MVATGFCRNGPSNDDNMGNNKQQYRLDELDDVIATTSTVFLGLTVGCARCHNHKYDPVTSADYYSLLAVFNGTVKQGVRKESDEKDKAKKPVKLQAWRVDYSGPPRTAAPQGRRLQTAGTGSWVGLG